MDFRKLTSDELRLHKGVSFPGISTGFVCYDGQGRVLQAKRSAKARDEHGRWDFGAGGLKHGQTAIDNMKRELLEEFNLIPLKTDFVGYLDVFREMNGMHTHWLYMSFAVLVDPSKLQINEPDMFDEYGWFDLDRLPEPNHSVTKLYLETHGDTLREIIKRNTKTAR